MPRKVWKIVYCDEWVKARPFFTKRLESSRSGKRCHWRGSKYRASVTRNTPVKLLWALKSEFDSGAWTNTAKNNRFNDIIVTAGTDSASGVFIAPEAISFGPLVVIAVDATNVFVTASLTIP
jgi:hypothetical protein